jgi:hypothetical protein
MATSRDITSGNSYTGNSNLGGRYSQGVTIDTTPLARLATFTYYRDQNLWQQKQIDDKAAAKEISDMTAYDLTSPMTGYSDHLKGKLNEIRDFIRDNPNALSYNKDAKGFQKFKEMQNEFLNARKSANTSDVIYNARKTAAEKAPTKEIRDFELKRLERDVQKLFEGGIDGALNNTLNSAPEIKPDDFKLPDIPLTKRVKVIRNASDVEIDKIEFADPSRAMANADAIMFGFRKPIDKNTERWKSLSETDRELEEEEYNIINTKQVAIQRTTDEFNGLLKSLKETNPNIKVSDIPLDMIPSDTLAATINSAKIYNESIAKINAATGEKYKPLNLDDGISGSELLVLNAFQKNKDSLYSETDKDVTQTDRDIKLSKLAIERQQESRLSAQATGGGAGNGQAAGNALDSFKAGSFKNFDIQGGLFLNKDGSRKSGRIVVTKGFLPAQIVTVAEAAKIELPGNNVSVEVENGIVTGVYDKKGNIVDRELIENGQKKFDTEQKGQERTQWGAGNTQKVLSNTQSKQSTKAYSAKMPDGSIVTSVDGKTWVDKNGKQVQ